MFKQEMRVSDEFGQRYARVSAKAGYGVCVQHTFDHRFLRGLTAGAERKIELGFFEKPDVGNLRRIHGKTIGG